MRALFIFAAVSLIGVFAAEESIDGYKTTYEITKATTASETVKKGDKVTVHATGTVKQSSKKFWSTKDAG